LPRAMQRCRHSGAPPRTPPIQTPEFLVVRLLLGGEELPPLVYGVDERRHDRGQRLLDHLLRESKGRKRVPCWSNRSEAGACLQVEHSVLWREVQLEALSQLLPAAEAQLLVGIRRRPLGQDLIL
jgi:hypothetical protein